MLLSAPEAWVNGECRSWHGHKFAGGKAHQPPPENCTCGVYGCLTLEHLHSQYPDEASELVAVIQVGGVTHLGTTGLRAEYARVVAYWADDPDTELLCLEQFPNAEQFGSAQEMAQAYSLCAASHQ